MSTNHTDLRTEAIAVLRSAERLYDGRQIAAALDGMAQAITKRLAAVDPLVICVMNGGLMAAGPLLSRLDFPLQLDYLHATRYRGETSGADVHWLCEPQIDLRGRTVLVIDDILDEGHTLTNILDYCTGAGVAQVRTAVLVQKQHDRLATDIRADYIGLQVKDRYVFGFGMDYRGYLRNLNGVFVLGEEGGA